MLVDIIIYQLYIGVQEMIDIHSIVKQSSIEAELIDDRLFTVTNIHDSLDSLFKISSDNPNSVGFTK